jgi:DNA invertase Pin-like site-specific DNA recombinase
MLKSSKSSTRTQCQYKVLSGIGAPIDTTTLNGRLCFDILAALAEFERESIAERTRARPAVDRAHGRKDGHPRIMAKTALQITMVRLKHQG